MLKIFLPNRGIREGGDMSFSAHEVLEESWAFSKRTYWRWWPVVIVAVLVPAILQIIAGLLTGWASDLDGFAGSIVGLLGALVGIVAILAIFLMVFGLYRNAYAVSGGENPSVGRLFVRTHFWWFVVASLIYVAMVVIGLLALVIPGLIIAFMLALFPYALIAGNAGNGFSALATSWDRITSNFWKYIGLRIVLTGVPLAVIIAGVVVIGILSGGAFAGAGLFGSGLGEGILVAILVAAGLIGMLLLYVLAIIFTYVSDALAYRKLAPDWA
jgi:hypothetical protein